jgi:hypothetical protein
MVVHDTGVISITNFIDVINAVALYLLTPEQIWCGEESDDIREPACNSEGSRHDSPRRHCDNHRTGNDS